MNNPVRKLNPLLRLAAISGVETAIKVHIRRGDDLNARDGAGATPLILAAGRRRVGVVKLLLDAEANPALADQNGMDALAHALKTGCSETIAILTDAMARLAVTEPAKGPSKEMVKSTAEGVDRISAALQEDYSRRGRVLGLDEQPTSVEALDVVLPADNGRTATLGEGGGLLFRLRD
nr:ankyrin repeat domain-containing protein [Chromobacterium sp. ASV5]